LAKSDYSQVYSEISEQQKQVEEAKKRLQRTPSIPEVIRQREARMSSPQYRRQYAQQQAAKQETLSDIKESEGDIEKQLETIKEYEKKGYKVKDTDEGYQFSKKVKVKSKSGKGSGSKYSAREKRYDEYTDKIKDVNKTISRFKRLRDNAGSNLQRKMYSSLINKFEKAKKSLINKRKRYKTPKVAQQEIERYETVSNVLSRLRVPESSPSYRFLERVRGAEPTAETRLVASGLTKEYYKDVGKVDIPDFEGAYGVKVPGETFEYGKDPYEDIVEYYENLPSAYGEKLGQFRDVAINTLPISDTVSLTPGMKTYQQQILSSIPEMPDFYKSNEGKDVLGMETAYKNIMRQFIVNEITEEEAKEKLSKEFEKKLKSADLDTRIKWFGYNPEIDDLERASRSKKIFLRQDISDDINKYTEKYESMKKIATGDTKKFPSRVPSAVSRKSTQLQVNYAKNWLSENPTPEEYSEQLIDQEGEEALLNWKEYYEEHPDKRALVLKINKKGKDLTSMFTPSLDYKKAESEEWKELGRTFVLPEFLRPVESAASVAAGALFGEKQTVTPAQFSKAGAVATTQFPRLIWTAASAIPPAIESGDYAKEYREQLEPQIYGAGYRLSETARLGHRTGEWLPYGLEIATSPAMTDVVYPLTIGAAFTSATPVLSKAGELVTRGGSRIATKVGSAVLKKMPKLSMKLGEAGIKRASLRRFGAEAGKFFGRTVVNPYGMTTVFMAPSAVDIGAKTALYQQGKISRAEWIRSLQQGARTGFQLGMFSAGTTYKPTGQFTKSVKRFSSKLKHAIEHPRGYYTVSKGGIPSEGYYYSSLERVSPMGKRTLVIGSKYFRGIEGSKQASLRQFGMKYVKPKEYVTYVGDELTARKYAKKFAGDIDALKGEGLTWTETLGKPKRFQRTFELRRTYDYIPPDVSTRYATVKKWFSRRWNRYGIVPVEKIPKLEISLKSAKKSPVISKKNILKSSKVTTLEDYGFVFEPKIATDSLQWASSKYILKGKYQKPIFKATRNVKEPYYYMKEGVPTKGIPDIPTTQQKAITVQETVKEVPVRTTPTETVAVTLSSTPAPASYYSPWGGRGMSKYLGETIYTGPSEYWKSKIPALGQAPTGPKFYSDTNIDMSNLTGVKTGVGTRRMTGSKTETGLMIDSMIKQRYENWKDILQEQLRDISQTPISSVGLNYQTRQQLKQRQAYLTEPILDVPVKTSSYEIPTPKPKAKKPRILLLLPGDKDKKKIPMHRDYYGRAGLGYKERFYKVKSLEIGKKPKYMRIVK